jgi:hypothetical protein
VTRSVTLHLDEFGQRSLDRIVSQGEGSPATALRAAAIYYLNDRGADRPAWGAPRFSSGGEREAGLRVSFDDETWAALEQEAERQGVAAEALAVHALLYFLADLDTGRLGELLVDALHEE